MSEWMLTALDDGRVLLTADRVPSPEQAREWIRAFQAWRETPQGVMVVGACRVQRATEVTIDLSAFPDHAGMSVDERDDVSVLARHKEPHECPREDSASACDFNRYAR